MQSNEDLQKRLGARIRAIRLKRGLSQEAFADACGIHRTHQSLLERGRLNVKIQTLRLIARELKVTLSELFDGVA